MNETESTRDIYARKTDKPIPAKFSPFDPVASNISCAATGRSIPASPGSNVFCFRFGMPWRAIALTAVTAQRTCIFT